MLQAIGLRRILLLFAVGSSGVFAQDAGSTAHLASDPPRQSRLTPGEYLALPTIKETAGTSAASGLESRILKGDPSKLGLYTILLKVPANTRIEAHDHPDERVATVISGDWYYGYGAHFDERELKQLPPGSFYTEPAHEAHFARTGATPVVVQITGIGPTGTHYVEAANQRHDSSR